MRQAKRQLDVTLAASEVGLWRWDVESDVFIGDLNLRHLFGMGDDIEETHLEAMAERLHDDDRERVLAAIRQVLEQGEDYDEEYRVVWPDGSVRWIRARGRVKRDENGKAVEFPGIVVDVSRQKRAEEALLELNHELEQRVRERTAELQEVTDELQMFLYSASHDLRAPLRGIDGFSKVLLDDYDEVLDEAGRDHLERIRSGARRIGLLIDGLLELSRLSRTPIVPLECDLSALANQVVEDLRARDRERRVKATVQPGMRARGDVEMLRLLLEELLENCWTFARHHQECVIEVFTHGDGEGKVFCVRDNGIGFDPAFADSMFLPFRRIHSPSLHDGTGIGLALARRVVLNHGGRIWAESKIDEGATFYFTLAGKFAAGSGRLPSFRRQRHVDLPVPHPVDRRACQAP